MREIFKIMPLRNIVFEKGFYYHVYNRGSEKRLIFLEKRDYLKFLKRTQEYFQKYNISILCFCLMPNHFHFLLKQEDTSSIALFMNVLQLAYAKYFNTKYRRVGPLYQGRFKAKIVENDEYLLQLSAYIHRNPLSLIPDSGNPQDSRNQIRHYPYSSYKDYLSKYFSVLTKPQTILNYFSKTNKNLSYESFVENFKTNYENYELLIDE